MRPRLWLAPLAADPGTDLLRDHAGMLLLDRNGKPLRAFSLVLALAAALLLSGAPERTEQKV